MQKQLKNDEKVMKTRKTFVCTINICLYLLNFKSLQDEPH